MKGLRLAALAVFLWVCVAPADTPSHKTFMMFNGREWQEMTPGNKVSYLKGLQDALALDIQGTARTPAEFTAAIEEEWANGFTFRDYIGVMDTLYREPENLVIPIPMAVKFYCVVKLKGIGTASELEESLIRIRTEINAALRGAAGRPVPPPAPAIPPGFELETPAAPAKP